ncbi:MAG: transcriptional repressor LexA [Gammaproteobacteria bacterium]|nr:transcriptional repressor LexA [Gammaproteobacteria bacterium]MDE0246923.1 transcriptional repressor LexA [Gammaproteobacteria bacterium]
MPLTKRQREIFDWLASYIADHGYAPSFEEIGRHFGFTSLATVHEHVSNLERKGYIRKSFNQSRSIELVGDGSVQGGIVLPLLGEVAAGQPIEAIVDEESILVPPSLTRRTGKHYVLRVRGNSMIDEQIRDGDYIIVASRETAGDGDMVIALIGGESATMKKLYREEDGRLRLQPANASLAPMYFPADSVQVQGIVVGVMRRY